MTHDQLAAFAAVATLSSFTLAARHLHKSQSAVSKLVRNLEAELGVELFDREAYRAALTDAGRVLLERALGVLDQVRELAELGQALAGEHEPAVRLAIDAITPLPRVLGVLRAAGQRFPRVRLELSTEHLEGSLHALEQGRVDLAVTSRAALDPRRLEAEPFEDVAIVAVAHRDHPLAAAEGPVPAALLRRHPQIVLSDSAHLELGPSINVLEAGLRWNVSDLAAKKEIILAGMGWGGLPRHLVREELQRGTLVALRVREFRAESIGLSLVRRRDRPAGPMARLLWAGLLAGESGALARPGSPEPPEPARPQRGKAARSTVQQPATRRPRARPAAQRPATQQPAAPRSRSGRAKR